MTLSRSASKQIFSAKLSLSYLYWVTFIMIFLSSLFYYFSGYLGGDLTGIEYEVDNFKLMFFTAVYLLGLYGSLLFSKMLSDLSFNKYVLVPKSRSLLYLFFVIFFLITFFSVVAGGAGTIHRGAEVNRYADLFFALFNPYFFMVLAIYFVCLDISRSVSLRFLLFFLMVVYIFLVFISGFTGFLIPVLPILISTLHIFFSKRKVIFLLVMSVLLFPFIRLVKLMVISGVDGFSMLDIDVELVKGLMVVVVERFSAVPNMIFISESLPDKNVFIQTNYLPFFQGYMGSLFHKALFSEPVSLITLSLHQIIQNTDSDSNSTFPIVSYFSLDFVLGFFAFLYAFFLVFIVSRLLNAVFGGDNVGKELMSFLLFFVAFYAAFNGWWWNIWGIIQAFLIFSFIVLLNGKLCNRSMFDQAS